MNRIRLLSGSTTLQIVRRPDDLHTFKALPRRRAAGRTLARITRHRRTVRDYERLAAHHETCIYRAMIIVMTRRRHLSPAAAHLSFSSRLSDERAQLGLRLAVHAAATYVAERPALPVMSTPSPAVS